MAQGHFHNTQKKSADDQFSISSDSPDCEIDEKSECCGIKGKGKKKSAVSNYVQGDKTVSHTQRQLQGCQHSSWYCRTSLWLVPNLPDCHCRSGGCWGTGAECRGVGATSPQFASSLAGAQHTHKVLLKMHVETYFSGRLLIPVKKTLEVFAVNREECIA